MLPNYEELRVPSKRRNRLATTHKSSRGLTLRYNHSHSTFVPYEFDRGLIRLSANGCMLLSHAVPVNVEDALQSLLL